MPRQAKPTRLYLEPERRYPDGRVRSASTWVIRDGDRKISTGCPANDREGAERRLAVHLAEQHVAVAPKLRKSAAETSVADVIAHYASNAGSEVSRPKDLAARLSNLLEWWGDRTLEDVAGYTCREYVKHRGRPAAARRELEDFRAAIRLYAKDGLCREHVVVTLPDKSASMVDFLTRDQAAALIWYLYRHRSLQHGKATRRWELRHIVPFVLTAIYTGTRSSRIWTASFVREPGRPWIDVEGGVFHRAYQGEAVSPTKRAGSVRIPDRLLAHMRRWSRTRRYLVQWRGRPSDPKGGLSDAMDAVFGEGHPFVRHSFRHTCATWLLWSGTDIGDIAAYLSMTREVLMKVYGHEHPDADRAAGEAFSKGRAGRRGRR